MIKAGDRLLVVHDGSFWRSLSRSKGRISLSSGQLVTVETIVDDCVLSGVGYALLKDDTDRQFVLFGYKVPLTGKYHILRRLSPLEELAMCAD